MTQWGLDALFNPAKRHMDEEKRRLQSTREEIGDSSGGKRIDLESGRVTIRRDQGPDAEGDSEATEPRARPQKDAKSGSAPRSAAAERAAARRARTAKK